MESENILPNNGSTPLNEKIISKAKKIFDTLRTARANNENKSVVKSTKALNKLAYQYPAELAAIGWTVTEKRSIMRVMEFGCLCSPVDFFEANDRPVFKPFEKSPVGPLETQMRFRHEYYNALLDATAAIREAILAIAGPHELAYRAHCAAIEGVNKKIGEFIYKFQMAKRGLSKKESEATGSFNTSLEFKGLTAERSTLYKTKTDLAKAAGEERKSKDFVTIARTAMEQQKGKDIRDIVATAIESALDIAEKKNKETGKDTTIDFFTIANQIWSTSGPLVNKVRNEHSAKGLGRGNGLYQGNYLAVDENFNNAVKNWTGSLDAYRYGFDYHYQEMDGSRPASLLKYSRWDRAGAVSIQTSNSKEDQPIETALNGKNTRIQIRRMVASDLVHFPQLVEKTEQNSKFFNGKVNPNAVPAVGKTKVDFSSKKSERLYLVKIRVQSTGSGNKIPVFAVAPVILHRDLPTDAEIRTATFITKKDSRTRTHKLLLGLKYDYETAENAVGEAEITIGMNNEIDSFGSFSRTHSEEFDKWLIDAKAKAKDDVGTAASKGRTRGESFEWLTSDGNLVANPHILRTGEKRMSLMDIMSQNDLEAKELLLDAIEGEDASKRRKIPAALVEEGIDLVYTDDQGNRKIRFGSITAAFYKWRLRMAMKAEAAQPGSGQEVLGKVRGILKVATDIHYATEKDKKYISENPWDNVLKGGDLADGGFDEGIIDLAVRTLGLSGNDAWFFCVFCYAVQRHDHLLMWLGNMENTARRRRKDEYRKFVFNFLKGVKTLTVKKANLRTTQISEAQKSACATELIQAIESFAGREGIEIKEEKIAMIKKVTEITKKGEAPQQQEGLLSTEEAA